MQVEKRKLAEERKKIQTQMNEFNKNEKRELAEEKKKI